MNTFEKEMRQRQVWWRKDNVTSREWGTQNGKQYEWILPYALWEEGLWPGIRSDSKDSLAKYLHDNQVQKHQGVHNLLSSWMLCANLYFPFGTSKDGRELLAAFLCKQVHPDIKSVESVELEYAERDALSPSQLLGEEGGNRGSGQTSPDVAFLVNAGRGLVLTENKLVEHSFYPCSARKKSGSDERPGNPDPTRCENAVAVLDGLAKQCHQVAWGRKYWEHLAPVVRRKSLESLNGCPAAKAGYQLFRQQALAEGIAKSSKYDLVVSCLAVDERNDTLRTCLASTGIADIRQWGQLFNGKAHFAVFTHQDWVGWVRAKDASGQWQDWLRYVEARYGFTP